MDDHAHTRSHLFLGLAVGLLIGTCVGYLVGTRQMMQGFAYLHESSPAAESMPPPQASSTPASANPDNPLHTILINPFN